MKYFYLSLIVFVLISAGLFLYFSGIEAPSILIPYTQSTPAHEESYGETGPVVIESPVIFETAEPSLMPTPSPNTAEPSAKRPQFVILAFDGSQSRRMWRTTIDFAKELTEQGEPLHFTYFISGVYFLGTGHHSDYSPPGHPVGSSAIGFGSSVNDILQRIDLVNEAYDNGNEIGSHLNGHYDGTKWSSEDWESEISQFFSFVFSFATHNGMSEQETAGHELHFDASEIVGIRVPVLGINNNIWSHLVDRRFRYDTSEVGKATEWPKKNAYGLWEFPLASIRFADQKTTLLSMDYNFYYKQSGGRDTAVKNTPEWDLMFSQVMTSYRNYFNTNYFGTRAPVFIGHHFSLWNDGVYWEAMKAFATEECGKPEVRCTTYRELADYMDQNPI